MSAKTSPSNSRDANVSAGAAGVVPPNVASGVVQIKKELPSDEIKVCFMNEIEKANETSTQTVYMPLTPALSRESELCIILTSNIIQFFWFFFFLAHAKTHL